MRPLNGCVPGFLAKYRPIERAVLLDAAGAVVVDLDHHVGALGQPPAVAVGQLVGELARRPAAQHALRVEADAHLHRVAGAVVLLVVRLGTVALRLFELAALAGQIDEVQRVMQDAVVARLDLDGRDELVLVQVGGQHETAEQVAAGRADGHLLGHGQHQVRLAELPALDEFPRRWGVLGIALRNAAVRPGRQRGHVLVGHVTLVVEGHALDRLPGRHLSALGVVFNVRGPVDGLLIGHERERGDLAGPMALLAVLLQDRLHVAMERHRRLSSSPCPRRRWDSRRPS